MGRQAEQREILGHTVLMPLCNVYVPWERAPHAAGGGRVPFSFNFRASCRGVGNHLQRFLLRNHSLLETRNERNLLHCCAVAPRCHPEACVDVMLHTTSQLAKMGTHQCAAGKSHAWKRFDVSLVRHPSPLLSQTSCCLQGIPPWASQH